MTRAKCWCSRPVATDVPNATHCGRHDTALTLADLYDADLRTRDPEVYRRAVNFPVPVVVAPYRFDYSSIPRRPAYGGDRALYLDIEEQERRDARAADEFKSPPSSVSFNRRIAS